MVAEATVIVWVLIGADRDVSDASVGLLIACATLPQIALAPWVGRRADVTARPARLLAALIVVGGTGLTIVGAGLGSAPFAVLVAGAALVAVSQPAMTGALSGIATRARHSPTFEAWDAASYGGAAIGAQLLVAVAVAVWTSDAALVAIVALALAATAGVGALPLPTVPDRHARRADIRTVLRSIADDRSLRAITILTTLSMSAFGGVAIAAVDIAERTGRDGDAGSQLVLAMAIGAGVGSVVCIRIRPPVAPLRQAVLSVCVLAVAFGLAAAAWWPVAIVAFAVAGFADAPLLVATFAIRNRRGPAPIRASIYTVSASMKVAATALGAVGVGLLVDRTDGPAAVGALALAQLVALGSCAISLRFPERAEGPWEPATARQ